MYSCWRCGALNLYGIILQWQLTTDPEGEVCLRSQDNQLISVICPETVLCLNSAVRCR